MADSLIDVLELLANSIRKSNRFSVPVPKRYSFENSIYSSIEDFFYFYERYCESEYGCDTVSWLQVLPDFVTGEAARIVNSFGCCRFNKYSDVKLRLIAASSKPAILYSGLADFFGLRRKPSETITCYTIRLEAAVNRTEISNQELKNLMVQNKMLESLDRQTLEHVKSKFGLEVAVSNLGLEKFIRLLEMDSSLDAKKNVFDGKPNCKQWQVPVNYSLKCWNCGKPGHLKRACLDITRKRSKGKPKEKLYYGPRRNVWSGSKRHSLTKHKSPVPGIGASSSASYYSAYTTEKSSGEDSRNINSQYIVPEALNERSSETFNYSFDNWEPSLDESKDATEELAGSAEDMSSLTECTSLLEKSDGWKDESGYFTNQSYSTLESAKLNDRYLTLAFSIDS